jgi:ATP-dependent RNA helicase DDX20
VPTGSDALQSKVSSLLQLLASVSFHQAVVFCNNKQHAEWLAQRLTAAAYPAAYLSGSRAQEERMEAVAALRAFKLRVGGRGMCGSGGAGGWGGCCA